MEKPLIDLLVLKNVKSKHQYQKNPTMTSNKIICRDTQ